jgi:hypothetical protein
VVAYVTVQFSESVKISNYGPDTPSADRRDRAWHRTDTQGRPLGTWFFYNGVWVKDWGGLPFGLISIIQNVSLAAFDVTGRATAPDWLGWCLCNGQNGTDDLRDRFILGAGSEFPQGVLGGEKETVLTIEQIPSHKHTTQAKVFLDRNTSPASSWERPNDQGQGGDATRQFASPITDSVGGGQAHTNMPPYLAKAYIQFLGYT